MDTVLKCLVMTGIYKDIVSGTAMDPGAPANRAMIVTQSFVAPCVLFHFAMGFVLTAVNLMRRDNPNFDTIPRSIVVALIVVDMTAGVTIDVLLAIGLCAVLCRTYLEVVSGVAGLKSGFTMIQRLVVLTINTGIWTALFTILAMTTSIRYPLKQIHLVFCFMISPVYVNMLLANLNARSFIRKGADEVIDFNKSEALSGSLSSIRVCSTRMPTLTGSKISPRDGSLQIIIESTRYGKVDDISSQQFQV
ncbi:hypothetical protein EST38_g13021 [Candolleomyces aberdarensis]|uniref:DUF6534 domain-containing protein n=1 Tax=Candolleomyces aberdarensis TaxID=2316362 RepID=A0A4Q2D100_9AGAR|nr:hypothetical protein EST38_g13021 [Candolleomyces aberdarensis]